MPRPYKSGDGVLLLGTGMHVPQRDWAAQADPLTSIANILPNIAIIAPIIASMR